MISVTAYLLIFSQRAVRGFLEFLVATLRNKVERTAT